MNLSLSEVLNLAQKWQNAAIEVGALIMIGTREIVIEFTGRAIVAADSITITNDIGIQLRSFTHSSKAAQFLHNTRGIASRL